MVEPQNVSSPAEIPDAYKDLVVSISHDVKLLYDSFEIPYSIQATMARQRYKTLLDVADRWELTDLKQKAPIDLGFDDLGFSATNKSFYATRLLQTVRRAKSIAHEAENHGSSGGFGITGATLPINTMGSPMGYNPAMQDKHQKAKLYSAWKAHTRDPEPKLSEIGSPDMVKKMWTVFEGGEFGLLDMKSIVPAQSDINEAPITKSTWQNNQFGSLVEVIDVQWKFPQDRKSWEKSLTIFRNTFLMVQWNFPQYTSFNITKEDMDKFYDFILGREIAGRQPEPPLHVLIHAERSAWKEINIIMREGSTAKDSLVACMGKSLFWLRMIDGSMIQGSTSSGYNQSNNGKFSRSQLRSRNKKNWQTKPWGNNNGQQWPKSKFDYNNKGGGKNGKDGGKWGKDGGKPGKVGKNGKPGGGKNGKDGGKNGKGGGKNGGKDGGKNGGKGGNKGGKWPRHWASMDKQGKEYCINFHIRGGCNVTNCQRSHRCPKKGTDGWICNLDHVADSCPVYP